MTVSPNRTPSRIARFRAYIAPYRGLLGFLKPYRKRWIIGLVFAGLFGVVDGSLPLAIQQVSSIIFYKKIENPIVANWLAPTGVIPYWIMIAACGVVPMIMVLRGFFSWINSYCAEWVGQRVLMDIRSKLLKSVMRQSMEFFNHTRGGDTTAKVMMVTMEAQSILTTLNTDLISQPVSLLTGLAVLFSIDWRFMAATLVLFPICLIPARFLGKKIRYYAQMQTKDQGNMMVLLNEIMAGIKVVKSFSRADFESERFDKASMLTFRQAMRIKSATESHGPIVEAIAATGVGLAFFYVHLTNLPGNKLIALCAGIFLLYRPIKTLTRLHLLHQRALMATEIIFELLHRKPSVEDKPEAIKLGHAADAIEMQDVSFCYREGIPAVRNISLRFEPGKHYALVGASGAGKSTVLSLILRFYDPTSGRVLIDGHDLRDLTQDSLREQIGIVSQDTFLFHDTIHNNVAYGKLGATREEIIAAAQLAHAHDFVLEQAQGYDTIIGDKGCMLSGGQQQRLAIARALLKNAPILLLDEATSALDSESEKHIQSAIEVLSKGRTTIAIAHRLSTILDADQIIVLDQGSIDAVGTHSELLERSNTYRRLYQLQFHGKE